MAIISTSSLTQIPIQKFGSFLKTSNKDFMYKSNFVVLKKAPALMIRSSIKNKVYEDQSQGIICYTDESGEIICEGYDEGPRFQPISWPICHPRLLEEKKQIMQLKVFICNRTSIAMAQTHSADETGLVNYQDSIFAYSASVYQKRRPEPKDSE